MTNKSCMSKHLWCMPPTKRPKGGGEWGGGSARVNIFREISGVIIFETKLYWFQEQGGKFGKKLRTATTGNFLESATKNRVIMQIRRSRVMDGGILISIQRWVETHHYLGSRVIKIAVKFISQYYNVINKIISYWASYGSNTCCMSMPI